MSEKTRPEAIDGKSQEERLAHALVSRSLISKEEAQQADPGAGSAPDPEALLRRLIAHGAITANQARRAVQELQTLLGQQIPGFIMQDKVGKGSMGTVYRALQVSMNRTVAVKILHAKLSQNRDLLDDLTREAHLAAKLSHNNIVQAIDVGQAGPLHYLVMEFIEGKTIREGMETGKVYEEKEAVEIVLQIAQALAHAHRRGLIHRDVKPANIVLTTEGIAKLADLGMARQTSDAMLIRKERGLAIGTPYYMAPEQIRGRADIDGRADLYSLGATLYHMTTGKPPFQAKEINAVMKAHLEEALTPPDHLNQNLSSGLGEVVEILMAKKREQRYSNADDLIIDLECLLVGEPPKLARKKIEASTLRGLSEGASDEEEMPEPEPQTNWTWVLVLGGLLTLSVLGNLLLLLRHHG